jgi:hypothetical protein
MKATIKVFQHDLETAKKKASNAESEKKSELRKFEKQIEEKTNRVRMKEYIFILYIYYTLMLLIKIIIDSSVG